MTTEEMARAKPARVVRCGRARVIRCGTPATARTQTLPPFAPSEAAAAWYAELRESGGAR